MSDDGDATSIVFSDPVEDGHYHGIRSSRTVARAIAFPRLLPRQDKLMLRANGVRRVLLDLTLPRIVERFRRRIDALQSMRSGERRSYAFIGVEIILPRSLGELPWYTALAPCPAYRWIWLAITVQTGSAARDRSCCGNPSVVNSAQLVQRDSAKSVAHIARSYGLLPGFAA